MYTHITLAIVFLSSTCVQCMNREAQIDKFIHNIEHGIITDLNDIKQAANEKMAKIKEKEKVEFKKSLIQLEMDSNHPVSIVVFNQTYDAQIALTSLLETLKFCKDRSMRPNSMVININLKRIKQFVTTLEQFVAIEEKLELEEEARQWLKELNHKEIELAELKHTNQNSTN